MVRAKNICVRHFAFNSPVERFQEFRGSGRGKSKADNLHTVRHIADLDRRVSQIDTAVEEATRRGQVGRAMALADQQHKTRDAMVASRQAATATLIETQTQRAALTTERERVEAAMGPVPKAKVPASSS